MERRDALKRAAMAAGSAVMAPSLLSILQSCKQQSRLDWTPAFLNEDQARFIAAFVDTLLPKTDTPGALDVKVDIFVDKVFDSMYDQSGQAGVVADIEAFNTACNDRFGDAFADLDQHDRAEMFNQLEKETGKFNGKVWGTAVGTQQPVGFYRSLKSMTLWAYFTSEEVGKNILSYDPVPGAYLGCIPLSDVGNTWSL
jgi:hypothetical protein